MEHNISKNDFTLFCTMSIVVVLYAWIAMCATIFGIFFAPIIWTLWGIGCGFLWYKKILIFPRPSRNLMFYMSIAIIFSLVIAWFTSPTIFSGRDQGALAEAAMQLSTHHKLIHHTPESDAFFQIYGRGQALNFPGFHYTPDGGLLTQFPLPYIAFLAGFYGTCGLSGLIIGNMVLLCLFIIAITTATRTFIDHKNTIFFMAILLTSCAIGWFAKFTLSENIAGALLWTALALLLILRAHPNKRTFYALCATISLLLFSRIEGLWFFVVFCIFIFTDRPMRDLARSDLWRMIFVPAITLCSIGIVAMIMSTPFIITIAHALLDASPVTTSATASIGEKMLWLFSIYGLYGLLAPLCISLFALILFLCKKIPARSMIPLFIVLPLFLYYFFPNISADHPWMLRRFAYALLPATILMSMIVIARIPTRSITGAWARIILPCILILINMPAFVTFLPYTDNATLLPQVAAIATQFTPRDLVLIDNNVAGNGWSMITSPLRNIHNVHAVYFFNPEDLSRLDTTAFDRVLLMIPDTKYATYADHFADRMHAIHSYQFNTTQLDLTHNKNMPPIFPDRSPITITGTIYQLQ